MSTGIVWFRRDLRLADHPALERALQSHDQLLLVYIDENNAPYSASRAWLGRSLQALATDIRARGGCLHVLTGDPELLLPRLAAAIGTDALHVSALHEAQADARDVRLARRLSQAGVAMRRAGGRLLTDADAVRTKSEAPYRVFTPFFKAALPTWRYRARPAPDRLACMAWPDSLSDALADVAPPVPGWDRAFWDDAVPGEAGAQNRLDGFIGMLDGYPIQRDLPALDTTSRLSPHLHFGEISPGRVLQAMRQHGGAGADKFIAELGWREFAYYVLQHWPASVTCNFNPKFDTLPWRSDPAGLQAWQHGRTGVPLVDAGMRQLWHSGRMHNRVRMVVASWLTKHMGIHWREGAAWFMHTLVDADIANNTLGWQWVAGTGVDAVPYFRIFNPVTQSRRFDPAGDYIRRWVPELAGLHADVIHAPWEAGIAVPGYPARPIVELAKGRADALARLKAAD